MDDIDELLDRFDGTDTAEAERFLRLECIRLVINNDKNTVSFYVVDSASRLVNFVLTGQNDIPAKKDG